LKIRVILPATMNGVFRDRVREAYKSVARPETVFDIVSIKTGPVTIESHYDEALALLPALEEVKKAEHEGYDGIIIYCGGDPGLEAARELVKIPVVGIGQASIYIAALIGHKMSIISPLENLKPLYDNLLRANGIESSKVASVRALSLSVLELQDVEKTKTAIIEASKRAMEDGADVIVLGCGSMLGMFEEIGQKIGIPVIGPEAAVCVTEGLISLEATHSRRYYEKQL